MAACFCLMIIYDHPAALGYCRVVAWKSFDLHLVSKKLNFLCELYKLREVLKIYYNTIIIIIIIFRHSFF